MITFMSFLLSITLAGGPSGMSEHSENKYVQTALETKISENETLEDFIEYIKKDATSIKYIVEKEEDKVRVKYICSNSKLDSFVFIIIKESIDYKIEEILLIIDFDKKRRVFYNQKAKDQLTKYMSCEDCDFY